MQGFKLSIKGSPEEAPRYSDDIKHVNIQEAVFVRNGTAKGKSTVDLVLRGKDGELYVTMVTKALLKTITDLED